MGVAVVLALACLGAAFYTIRGTLFSEAETLSVDHTFVDAATGKPYSYELQIGSTVPAPAPSGGKTGYPAEACFWNKDGSPKKDPTFVLLNLYKGNNEPTFCPDCGRLVVGHNPRPGPTGHAPPTKEEYAKGNKGRSPAR
jgi:hypothetical protein